MKRISGGFVDVFVFVVRPVFLDFVENLFFIARLSLGVRDRSLYGGRFGGTHVEQTGRLWWGSFGGFGWFRRFNGLRATILLRLFLARVL